MEKLISKNIKSSLLNCMERQTLLMRPSDLCSIALTRITVVKLMYKNSPRQLFKIATKLSEQYNNFQGQ